MWCSGYAFYLLEHSAGTGTKAACVDHDAPVSRNVRLWRPSNRSSKESSREPQTSSRLINRIGTIGTGQARASHREQDRYAALLCYSAYSDIGVCCWNDDDGSRHQDSTNDAATLHFIPFCNSCMFFPHSYF